MSTGWPAEGPAGRGWYGEGHRSAQWRIHAILDAAVCRHCRNARCARLFLYPSRRDHKTPFTRIHHETRCHCVPPSSLWPFLYHRRRCPPPPRVLIVPAFHVSPPSTHRLFSPTPTSHPSLSPSTPFPPVCPTPSVHPILPMAELGPRRERAFILRNFDGQRGVEMARRFEGRATHMSSLRVGSRHVRPIHILD